MVYYIVGEPCHTQVELARYSGKHMFLVVVDSRLGHKNNNSFWYSCDTMSEFEKFQLNLSNLHQALNGEFTIEYCQ